MALCFGLAIAFLYFGNRFVTEAGIPDFKPKSVDQINGMTNATAPPNTLDINLGEGRGLKTTERSTAFLIILGLTLLILAYILAKYVKFK